MKQLDQGKLNKAPLRGSLLRTYVAHVVTRSAVEVAFMTGQYLLYGFHLYPLFKCERDPCPNIVDCYVSRPTEKSVFMIFMQCIAAVSLFLNILEIMHLGYKKIKKGILDYYPQLRDDRDELDDCYASKPKKESVMHISTDVARGAIIASAPSDYNVLLERTQGTNMYLNLINPPAFVPPQNELATPQDFNDSRGSAQTPPEDICISTANEPCLPLFNSATSPKQEAEESSHLPFHGEDDSSEMESPDSPKCPKKAAHAFSFPTLPVSMARKSWRGHGSFHCATVLEGKSSDTDSCGCTKPSGGHLSVQTPSKSDDKHQSRPSTPESLDDSSSDSRHSPRPPSSSCKISVESNKSSNRAPDLQI